MLAPAPTLGPLVAPTLWNRIPLDWKRQSAGSGHHHASQRRRHLRSQSDGPPAFVLEVVELADDLLALLARVQLLTLEHRRVVLLEAVRTRSSMEVAEQPVAHAHLIRIEVARATYSLCHEEGHERPHFKPFGSYGILQAVPRA